MRVFILLIVVSFFSHTICSQNIIKSLETKVPGEGTVTIHQDFDIESLIGMKHYGESGDEGRMMKGTGYRVQVYAGSNSRVARTEAGNMGDMVKSYFPETRVYTFFSSPRWLCRIGDFRSIEEADAMMRKLKATGIFKEVAIVKDNINIHF